MQQKSIKIFALVAIILSICGYSALLYWQYNEYEKVRLLWQKKAEEKTKLIKEIEYIKQQLARFDKEEQEFRQYLFDERDVPAFLDEIASFARETEVSILDMKTKKFHRVNIPEGSNDLQASKHAKKVEKKTVNAVLTLAAMPIDVMVDGEFASLARFLEKLQEYKQLVNISDVSIKHGRTDYPVLQCRFTLRIYSLKRLEELTS